MMKFFVIKFAEQDVLLLNTEIALSSETIDFTGVSDNHKNPAENFQLNYPNDILIRSFFFD